MVAFISAKNYPALHAALVAIEVDNGAHHVGTTHPGTPVNLKSFKVRAAKTRLAKIEIALARLRQTPELFSDFLVGEEQDQNAIRVAQGDLDDAHKFIDEWFNGEIT